MLHVAILDKYIRFYVRHMPASTNVFLKYNRIIRLMIENLCYLTKHKFGIRHTLSGSLHVRKTPRMVMEYAREVIHDYIVNALTPEDIMDMRILELGPGDSFATALFFISMGARKVVCVDKFEPRRDMRHEIEQYTFLRSELGEKERERFDSAIILKEDGYTLNPERILYLPGVGVENLFQFFRESEFDLIVSRAVMRYVFGIHRAFDAMDKVLRPGGMMIHVIDLRDSGTFNYKGSPFHPLTFLTVPELLWRFMSSHCPRTNRKRLDFYKKKMHELGYDYQIRIRRVFGSNELMDVPLSEFKKSAHYSEENLKLIHNIRPELARPFRELSDIELLPASIILIAKKPNGHNYN